ncbi:alpha/beta fold hydrolase [Nannocystis sp. ILAH1]|uniref:alpha/beta hydrolase n=1 Tax=Nannocystis sp. ILAH1 TaxID=2996789 RepID=UPI00226EEE7E|nr:alpha/beta fold hydrolase [Nannocystis sp. ILAH1]MCY0994591.1 alpha/beta fold hydrolase [Nannocystis sp. ILAH1]
MRPGIVHIVGAALALLFGSVACEGAEPGANTTANGPGAAGEGAASELQAPCPGPSSSAITLATPTGDIKGSLLLPGGCGPFAVVLIHAGSGPTDRDGNAPGVVNDSLKLLAEGLAERGFAAVRFDKRGVAASAAAGPALEYDYRLDMYVDDAAAWLEMLAEDPRFRGVTFAGHSEGSLIGMLAAQRSPVDAFVSIAGAGRPAAELLREQLAKHLSGPLLAEANAILGSLEAGKEVAEVSPELYDLFRPSVQPYLLSWFPHDPAALIATITAPTAIVHGTTDAQTSVVDAELLAAAAPDAALFRIEGMNHVLKAATLDEMSQLQAYFDRSLPVVPELFARLVAWLNEVR